MKKENRKQIFLIIIAFVCMGIGWFNLGHQQTSIEVAAEDDRNEMHLGDVQLVNSNPIKEENNQLLSEIVPNDELSNMENKKENTNTVEEIVAQCDEEYFVETRLERDTMHSQMIETYQKMLENSEVGENQKIIAAQEITNITNIKNGIMISENLIKNKGSEDVVILVNNNVVSIVIKTSSLNQEQIAQIQNIVSRELNVNVENIHISKK